MFKFLFLFPLSCPVMAMDGEVSLGGTNFGKQPNGYWYQDGFQHTLNMSSPSASVGITNTFYDRYRYHIGYKYLGRVSTTAQCMDSDPLYAVFQKTGQNPLKLGTFNGSGAVNELYFTAGPEFHFGDWHIGAEAGLSIYQATWREQAAGYQYAIGSPLGSYDSGTQSHFFTGGIIGVSAGYGRTDIVLSVQDINGKDYVSSAYHGLATNLAVRYRF